MKILNVSIKNYRCFPDLHELPFEDITALIGPNDSGKTSLLTVLKAFFADGVIARGDFSTQGEPILVEIVFNPGEQLRPAFAEHGLEFGPITVKKSYEEAKKPTCEMSSLLFTDSRLNNIDSLSAEELKNLITERGIEGKYTNNSQRKAAVLESIDLEKDVREAGWISMPEWIGSVLPEYFFFPASTALEIESSPLELALKKAFRSSLNSASTGIDDILANALLAMDSHITELNTVVEKYLGKGAGLTVEPTLKLENSLVLGDPKLDRGEGSKTVFSQLGDGTKRRLILSIQSWANQIFRENTTNANPIMIFGFDEPDTHLHYEAQYELLQILQDMVSSRIQVIVCTHSIPIIDRLPAKSVRLMKPDRDNRVTSIEYVNDPVDDQEVSDFLASVGSGLGFPNSLLFYERCFLIVEGETEFKALPILYEKLFGTSMLSDGIRIFSAESSGSARKLSELLSGLGRSVVLLLDTDQKDKQPKSEDYEYDLQFVGDLEFEDSFTNAALVRVLNQYYPKVDEGAWSTEDIQAARNTEKFSHELVTVKIGEYHKARVSKPEFGRVLAESITAQEIPSEIKQVFHRLRAHSALLKGSSEPQNDQVSVSTPANN